MSQAKVDKRKEYKRHRRENIRKEKRKALLTKIAAWAVVALIVIGVGVAIGVSIYNNHQAKLAALPGYGTTSYLLSDYAGIRDTNEPEDDAVVEEETSEAETEAETEVESEAESAEETEAEETAEETEEETK